MKTILFLLFFTFSAWGQNNPQIKICLQNSGVFWSLDTLGNRVDNIGFCRYDKALIGSLTMLQYIQHKKMSSALAALRNTLGSHFNSCADAGAKELLASDSKGELWELCMFDDYSFTDKLSITEGLASNHGAKLKSALKL